MSAYKSDQIIVKKPVAEFLKKEFGEDYVIPRGHLISYVFAAYCSKKTKRHDIRAANLHKDWQKNVTFTTIQLTIPADIFNTYGYALTDTCQVLFRNFLEEYMNMAIRYSYLSTKVQNVDIPLQDQIDIIRKVSGITEDGISKDGLSKHLYRRFRKQRTNPQQLNLFS